jgi:hypothetical protein
VTVLEINDQVKNNFIIENAIAALDKTYPNSISIISESEMKAGFLAKQDLMVISLESWKKLVDAQSVWLSTVPSVLIIKP